MTVQAKIQTAASASRPIDAGVLLITHDMGVVADLADRMLVMQRGKIVEHGTTAEGSSISLPTPASLQSVPHLARLVAGKEVAGKKVAGTNVAAGEETTGPFGSGAPTPNVVDLRRVSVEYPKRGARRPSVRSTCEPHDLGG